MVVNVNPYPWVMRYSLQCNVILIVISFLAKPNKAFIVGIDFAFGAHLRHPVCEPHEMLKEGCQLPAG
jgi:hypothetical protein